MRMVRTLLVALAVLLWPGTAAAAVSPGEALADPKLEARARALARELRCVVCPNQSIDDSDADLAKDLRKVLRERLEAGDSDREVIGYLTRRYGDYVLLEPPLKPSTYLLWFAPLLFAAIALGLAATVFRRRK